VTHIVASIALLAVGGAAVWIFPRSILAFLTFQGALMAIYVARISARLRLTLLGLGLLVMMPYIGSFNGYYLEVATQVGISPPRRQSILAQHALHSLTACLVAHTECFGQPERHHHPLRHCVAVRPIIPRAFLECMAEGMPQVEQRPLPRLVRVSLHSAPLYLDSPPERIVDRKSLIVGRLPSVGRFK